MKFLISKSLDVIQDCNKRIHRSLIESEINYVADSYSDIYHNGEYFGLLINENKVVCDIIYHTLSEDERSLIKELGIDFWESQK